MEKKWRFLPSSSEIHDHLHHAHNHLIVWIFVILQMFLVNLWIIQYVTTAIWFENYNDLMKWKKIMNIRIESITKIDSKGHLHELLLLYCILRVIWKSWNRD